jgi:hypothetical protein
MQHASSDSVALRLREDLFAVIPSPFAKNEQAHGDARGSDRSRDRQGAILDEAKHLEVTVSEQ